MKFSISKDIYGFFEQPLNTYCKNNGHTLEKLRAVDHSYDFNFVKSTPKYDKPSIRKSVYDNIPHYKIVTVEQPILPTLNKETLRLTFATLDPIPGRYLHIPSYDKLESFISPYKELDVSGGDAIGFVGQIPWDKSMENIFIGTGKSKKDILAEGYYNLIVKTLNEFKGQKILFRHHPILLKEYNDNIFIKKIDEFVKQGWVTLDNEGSIFDFMKKCKLLVGVCSASLTEAFCSGKDVLVLSKNLWPSPLSISSDYTYDEKMEWLAIAATNSYRMEDISNGNFMQNLFEIRRLYGTK